LSKNEKGAERRFWKRFFLSLESGDNICRVKDESGRSGKVRIVNISLGGAQLKLAPDNTDSEKAIERFRELQELFFADCEVEKWGRHLCGASGFVRWVGEDRECGCQFFAPLGAGKGGK
jgi:hypothetical protein